jgi:hypothetical protein
MLFLFSFGKLFINNNKAGLFLFIFTFKLLYSTSVSSSLDNKKDKHIQFIIHQSLSQVVKQIHPHFTEKCNLFIQNCLFQTKWDKVFDANKYSIHLNNLKSKNHRNKRHDDELTFESSNNSYYYYYCQPILIGKYCIDYHLTQSNDIDYIQCVNKTISGQNEPQQFKKSIHRQICKQYSQFFYDSVKNGADKLFFFNYKKISFFISILYLFLLKNTFFSI